MPDTPSCTVVASLPERLAAARALLRRLGPALVERAEGQAGLRFRYGASGAARFRLVVEAPNLFLHFSDGAALPDPAGLLRGEGRRGRYLCLRDVAMLGDPAVLALIVAALKA